MNEDFKKQLGNALATVMQTTPTNEDIDLFLDELKARKMTLLYDHGKKLDELEIIKAVLTMLRRELADPVARIRVAEYISSVIAGELYE